jgi:GNAT superfamily N-acetyltransferase
MQVREVNSGAARREAREKLLEAARRREIDLVLVWRLDRWGQSVTDLLAALQELEHLGVGFVYLTEALDLTTPGDTPGTMPLINLVAETADGTLTGFAEIDLRSHADGCDPARPVGYLEGWFVAEAYRRSGIGRRLLAAAEDWARSHGCIELASDTWIDNELSQSCHEALGFEVVDRCVHYRKGMVRPRGRFRPSEGVDERVERCHHHVTGEHVAETP